MKCPETIGKSGKRVACSTAYMNYGCRCGDCCTWESRRNAERYTRRKEEGRCTKCGAEELAPASKVCCQECLDKKAERDSERRARLKEEGRCMTCGAEGLASETRCQECLERKLESAIKRRREKRLDEAREKSPLTREAYKGVAEHLKRSTA